MKFMFRFFLGFLTHSRLRSFSNYVFLFHRQDVCQDQRTLSSLPICFLFVNSSKFDRIACMMSFFHSYRSGFFVHLRCGVYTSNR